MNNDQINIESTPVTNAQDTNNPAVAQQQIAVPLAEVAPSDTGAKSTELAPNDPVKTRADAPGKVSLTQSLPNLIACALGRKAAAEVAKEMNAYTNSKRAEKQLEPLPADKEKTEADVKKLVRENLADLLNEIASWRNLAVTVSDELNEVMDLEDDLDKRDLKLVVRLTNRLKAALDKTSLAA